MRGAGTKTKAGKGSETTLLAGTLAVSRREPLDGGGARNATEEIGGPLEIGISKKTNTHKLIDLADINPRLSAPLDKSALISFLPMSGVTAETASTTAGEARTYQEVSKGYTPFLNGDLLVAKITPCFENGKIAQATLSHPFGFGSTEFHVIRPKSDKIDARYLLHFLRLESVRREGERRMTGSAGQKRVPEIFLNELVIPLPPLPEQRRIAEVLDRAEGLRAKRKAGIAQLEQLSYLVFIDLFGDPFTNPKNWPIIKIGDFSDVQGGLQVSHARNNLPFEVPYLRVANVFRSYLDLDEVKSLKATESEISRTLLKKNDLLVVEGHGNPNEIGRGALWDGSIERCIHQNHIIRVRMNLGKVVPRFVCEYFNSPGGRRYLIGSGKSTSGLNTISVSEVRDVPIAIPPLPLQEDFSRRIAAIETLKATHRASLAQLDALFASLQHRAFRGEL